MRHDWKPHPDSCTIRRPFEEIRVCQNCGAEQTKETNQSWGRVTGYQWWPLAGRCKKNEKTSKA